MRASLEVETSPEIIPHTPLFSSVAVVYIAEFPTRSDGVQECLSCVAVSSLVRFWKDDS